MRNTVIWSLLSVVLASGGLMTACDNDATIAKSGKNESCNETSDCSDDLKCIAQVCVQTSSGSGNEGGDGSFLPAGPALGGEGESCENRAQCEADLRCFNQRCVADPTGEGGAGNTPDIGGGIGETCGLTSDCKDGLACLPQDSSNNGGGIEFAGSNSIGVCTVVNSGITPSGMVCGHECKEAADCCELPVALHIAFDALFYPFGTGVKSCTELAELLTGVNCATALVGTVNAARCFADEAYCSCKADTWACTNGSCSYEAACSESGATSGGCPTYSRAGRGIGVPCDLDSEKCASAAVPTCTTDATCTSKAVADDPLDLCTVGECTCYKQTACYRKCNKDLDCAVGRSCDAKSKVCVASPECTSDAGCAVRYGDYRYKCVEDACQKPCVYDIDCNEGGLTDYNLEFVCNADKVCQSIGCVSDDECGGGAGGVKLFCAEPVAAAAGGVTSAITD